MKSAKRKRAIVIVFTALVAMYGLPMPTRSDDCCPPVDSYIGDCTTHGPANCCMRKSAGGGERTEVQFLTWCDCPSGLDPWAVTLWEVTPCSYLDVICPNWSECEALEVVAYCDFEFAGYPQGATPCPANCPPQNPGGIDDQFEVEVCPAKP